MKTASFLSRTVGSFLSYFTSIQWIKTAMFYTDLLTLVFCHYLTWPYFSYVYVQFFHLDLQVPLRVLSEKYSGVWLVINLETPEHYVLFRKTVTPTS